MRKCGRRFEKMVSKCEICGRIEDTEEDIEIFHRGCRLGQFFQRDRKAEKEFGIKKGSGLKILNLGKGKGKKGKELVKFMNSLNKKQKEDGK